MYFRVNATRGYLGLDVGSVSTNVVVIAEDGTPLTTVYLRTRGEPIRAVQEGLRRARQDLP